MYVCADQCMHYLEIERKDSWIWHYPTNCQIQKKIRSIIYLIGHHFKEHYSAFKVTWLILMLLLLPFLFFCFISVIPVLNRSTDITEKRSRWEQLIKTLVDVLINFYSYFKLGRGSNWTMIVDDGFSGQTPFSLAFLTCLDIDWHTYLLSFFVIYSDFNNRKSELCELSLNNKRLCDKHTVCGGESSSQGFPIRRAIDPVSEQTPGIELLFLF